MILLGPGSLYTSILPNLLIPEIAAAIAKSEAPRVYIANLMTQPGETAAYSLADHLRAIRRHTPRSVVDWVVANRRPISPEVAKRYRRQGAEQVEIDLPELQKLGYRVVLEQSARGSTASSATILAVLRGFCSRRVSFLLKVRPGAPAAFLAEGWDLIRPERDVWIDGGGASRRHVTRERRGSQQCQAHAAKR